MTSPLDPVVGAGSALSLNPVATTARHQSGDPVLSALLATGGPVGELVGAFPGLEQLDGDPEWLERWFLLRAADRFHGSEAPSAVGVPIAEVVRATADDRPCALKIERLLSVRPNWFRGFRELVDPIPVDSALLLIDGRNSTGKTSFAEALEWLFNGELARRALGGNGNAQELESCVGNHFRPAGAETWVEAVFRLEDGEPLALRRVLDADYGPTLNSVCRSRLFRDGVELDDSDAALLLDNLFGGAPPLLMQHTLRLFVHSTPSARRQYFERLLRLDELAALVERAILGAPKVAQLRRQGDHGALGRWQALKDGVAAGADRARLQRIEKRPPELIADAIRSELVHLAPTVCEVETEGVSFQEARSRVEAAQSASRQRSFPLLGSLRPKRSIDAVFEATFAEQGLQEKLAALRETVRLRAQARASAKEITDAQLAIAGVMAALTDAGLLPDEPESSIICPVCEYEPAPTLSVNRMRTVRGWEPVRTALEKADGNVAEAAKKLREHLQEIYRAHKAARPNQPDDESWEKALAGAEQGVRSAAEEFRRRVQADDAVLAHFEDALITTGMQVGEASLDDSALTKLGDDIARCAGCLTDAVDVFRRYADALGSMEGAVGTRAGADAFYASRDRWLAVGDAADKIAEDLTWEQAKRATADLLERIRAELKAVRQQLLESRRTGFNGGISEVWSTLRGDTYSVFSHLHIPEPKRKGYKVEIEVKARLDDGTTQEDVDALRVFSESQVNALGIAAFITRAKMLGHQVLIFDDPVQSMDEDHFHTFASDLLCHLLDGGFQVLVLTHNDTFARWVSTEHRQREDFTSLKITFSRERGSSVDLGHRRLKERLAKVDRALQKGDLDTGWLELRRGIERLLTVLRADHHDCGVKDHKWQTFTAGQMFAQGAGEIVRTKAPKLADQLHTAIDMAAAGAHDAAVNGPTDLQNALALVRKIANQFGIKD